MKLKGRTKEELLEELRQYDERLERLMPEWLVVTTIVLSGIFAFYVLVKL